MNRYSSCAPCVLSLALCFSLHLAEAFVVQSTTPLAVRLQSAPSSLTILHAKKKRRRKQQADSSPKNSSVSPDSKELPDFDLNDSVDDSNEFAQTASNNKSSSPPSKKASSSVAASATSTEVTANMMGSSEKPVRSVKELLSDRSLEQKFEFDDVATSSDQDVPDLLQKMARSSSGTGSSSVPEPSGSKRARQEARRSAAQARDQKDAQEQENPFAKIPFITDEDGKILPLKVIEATTWTGIFLLVAWEVYINSPLFERAAPMAPVVY